jgi:hypothetical protein
MPHVFAVLDEPELFWMGTTEAEVRVPVEVPIEPSALVKVDVYVSVTSDVPAIAIPSALPLAKEEKTDAAFEEKRASKTHYRTHSRPPHSPRRRTNGYCLRQLHCWHCSRRGMRMEWSSCRQSWSSSDLKPKLFERGQRRKVSISCARRRKGFGN